MAWKTFPIIRVGIFTILLLGASNSLLAQDGLKDAESVAALINSSAFAGRYFYEASFSTPCEFVLKEISPKCPDQRGEISFGLEDVHSEIDDLYGGLLVTSTSGADVIQRRLYFRGASVKGRRFCEAPRGSSLKSQDELLSERILFYSDDMALLGQLQDGLNNLSEACRSDPAS